MTWALFPTHLSTQPQTDEKSTTCRAHSSPSIYVIIVFVLRHATNYPVPFKIAFLRTHEIRLDRKLLQFLTLTATTTMTSQFDLSSAIETILVASTRILPQLLSSPSLSSLVDTPIALNPIVTAFWLTYVLIVLQIILSILSRSYSWNDRFWPFIPPFFSIIFAIHGPVSSDRRTASQIDQRLKLMSGLLIIWGSRLTANAIRRGYYSPGFLDYRYTWLQENILRIKFLFNIAYAVLVCGCMTVILAMVSSPLYYAWLARGSATSLSLIDAVATVGMMSCIILATIADNQQWSFQCRKARWLSLSPEDRKKQRMPATFPQATDGFRQTGLFAWSRHPNYFGEIAGWWFFYLFSVAASNRVINWTLVGPIAYTLIFQITTPLAEHISSAKYPTYRDYQKCVSRIIPSPFSRPMTRSSLQEKKTK